VPVILSSDKTQLTVFRGKQAYPVYMTIGNVLKDIRRKPSRRAYILIGYIPTTKLATISNNSARRRAQANLFHYCMRHLIEPISSSGELGIAMIGADGTWRRCHPIFAAFVGDYPEQTLVTCTYNGRCPKCLVPRGQLGEFHSFQSRLPGDAINTYRLADGDVHTFHKACRETSLKPVFHPFWDTLPFADVFLSITPDILHQLLQGVMKHVIAWLANSTVFGPAEIDARCRSLPPNHNIHIFTNGITTLSRVSGLEHKNMCRIIFGLIVDLTLPGGRSPSRVVKAVRAALDFLYLAQYPTHTTETLHLLDEALARFHENKSIFIDLGTRNDFNLPKLHALLHYRASITQFGTTDNYNTEQTERLHINTKDGFRATNHKNETPQMTSWLERREKVQQRAELIEQQQQRREQRQNDTIAPIGPPLVYNGYLKMTLHPTIKSVSFNILAQKYGATAFQDALADYIARVNNPGASVANVRAKAKDTLLPFRSVPVFHKIKFVATRDRDNPNEDTVDAVHVRPEQTDSQGQIVPSRFDTVLVDNGRVHAHRKKRKSISII
jgi:hypothetical protein